MLQLYLNPRPRHNQPIPCATHDCPGYGRSEYPIAPSLLACVSCWRRYLVARAGLWLDWSALITPTGQALVESGRAAWIAFVRSATDLEIAAAWYTVPVAVRKLADDIDYRSLEVQLTDWLPMLEKSKVTA